MSRGQEPGQFLWSSGSASSSAPLGMGSCSPEPLDFPTTSVVMGTPETDVNVCTLGNWSVTLSGSRSHL